MVKQRKLNTPEKRARVGERIKVAATQAGLSLKDLAEQAAVPAATVYQYVRGITAIPEPLLERIATVTRVHRSFFDPDQDGRQALALPMDAAVQEGVVASVDAEARVRLEIEYQKARAVVEAYRAPRAGRASYLSAIQRLLVLSRARDGGELPVKLLADIGRAQQEDTCLELAESSLQEALELAEGAYPEVWAQVILDMAECCLEQGAVADAERYLNKLAAVESSPLQWAALAQLGRLHTKNRDYSGAIGHFERAAQSVAAGGSGEQRLAQRALTAGLAEIAWHTGHLEAARALWAVSARLAEALRDAPAYFEALVETARCEEASGNLTAARLSLEKAVTLAAFSPGLESRMVKALVLLMRIQFALGAKPAAHEQARRAYHLARKSDSPEDNIRGHLAMARSRLAAGHYDDSLEYAAEALAETLRSNHKADIAEARLIRASAWLRLHENSLGETGQTAPRTLDKALAEAKAALAAAKESGSYPLLLESHLTIAELYQTMGRHAESNMEAAALLAIVDAGPTDLAPLLESGADSLAALIGTELEVLALFRGAMRVDLPLVEWRALALQGGLAAKRKEPEAAQSFFAYAAQVMSAIAGKLNPAEVEGYLELYPRAALAAGYDSRIGIGSAQRAGIQSMLNKIIARPDAGMTAVVGKAAEHGTRSVGSSSQED